MSALALLIAAFSLVTLLLIALGWMLRRQRNALAELSRQLQRIAVGGPLQGRVDLDTDHPELASLTTAVNHLLARASIATPPPVRADASAAPVSALGDRVHEAVLIHGAEGIVYANRQFAQLLGAQPEDLPGRRLEDLVPPEYAELVADNLRRRLAGEPTAERYEVDLLGLQGQSSRLELSSWQIEHAGQPVLLIVGVEVLPTMTVGTLPVAEGGGRSRARLALESLDEAVVTIDAQSRVDYLNPNAVRLFAVDAARARGIELEELARPVVETDRKLLIHLVRQALSAGAPVNIGRRALVLMQNGSERLAEISAAPMRDESGDVTGAVLLLHDVTEARGLTRQMSYQATHDALTGLVNRREFEHRMQEGIDVARRGDGTHVLCYLDLDRFKLINDSSGHQAGDSLLREVAKLLRTAVRDSDTVGRLGGDEFGLLLVGCPLDKARQIADDVCRKVADYRFVWKDRIFNIGISIGLVEIGREGGSVEETLAAADSACYVAKRQGGHVVVYSARDELMARQSGEIHWLQTLQTALKENRFELYCQPIVATFAGDEGGPALEVLLRLKDHNGVDLRPSEFLLAAERYRLIGMIDRHVVQTTLNALGRGAIAVPRQRSVAINISGQTLADTQFLEFVVDCFDSTGALPAQVCFEISENSALANIDHARRFIGVLHGMGCRFALDDFGSGLGGAFTNLKNLSMDYLKIDGSFMRNLGRDAVNQAMVTAMIKLARMLNFKVIAEQVEDNAAMDAARRMGVDYLQGFAIGRPEPLALAA